MSELARLLIVDDDPAIVDLLREVLASRYHVTGEISPIAALERIATEDFDVVISDVEMPGMRGPDLLARILERKPGQLVVMITAFGSIELAVAAIRAGACDFVTKPFKTGALLHVLERVLRERSMRRELIRLRRRLWDPSDDDGNLVEGELFGVRRGAFTDARESRDGLFVEASTGTLFLDEIGEMPLDVQPKLLRALESGRVRPVGGTDESEVDVRVIAASNRNLDEAINEGRFRLDLFFRLNVIPIEIPPLRERREDIPELAQAFLARVANGQHTPIGITDEALRWLAKRDWPGNVRELANVIERAVALTDHETIVLEDVRDVGQHPTAPTDELLAQAAERHLSLEEVERGYIQRVLDTCQGNVSRAARILGIDRRTMYRKLK